MAQVLFLPAGAEPDRRHRVEIPPVRHWPSNRWRPHNNCCSRMGPDLALFDPFAKPRSVRSDQLPHGSGADSQTGCAVKMQTTVTISQAQLDCGDVSLARHCGNSSRLPWDYQWIKGPSVRRQSPFCFRSLPSRAKFVTPNLADAATCVTLAAAPTDSDNPRACRRHARNVRRSTPEFGPRITLPHQTCR
jgi:hypothetical protein